MIAIYAKHKVQGTRSNTTDLAIEQTEGCRYFSRGPRVQLMQNGMDTEVMRVLEYAENRKKRIFEDLGAMDARNLFSSAHAMLS